jgi:transcriptional regulator with XRE-family HTH domain
LSTSKTGPVAALIDWKAFGKRLRALRGFETTQAEFARRIGVSQGYYSLVERGQREAGPEILLRISYACGKSLEWLLTGREFSTRHM